MMSWKWSECWVPSVHTSALMTMSWRNRLHIDIVNLLLLGVLEVFWFCATLIISVDNNSNNNNICCFINMEIRLHFSLLFFCPHCQCPLSHLIPTGDVVFRLKKSSLVSSLFQICLHLCCILFSLMVLTSHMNINNKPWIHDTSFLRQVSRLKLLVIGGNWWLVVIGDRW